MKGRINCPYCEHWWSEKFDPIDFKEKGDILTLETEHVCPECGQEFALEATIELEIDTFMLVEDDE